MGRSHCGYLLDDEFLEKLGRQCNYPDHTAEDQEPRWTLEGANYIARVARLQIHEFDIRAHPSGFVIAIGCRNRSDALPPHPNVNIQVRLRKAVAQSWKEIYGEEKRFDMPTWIDLYPPGSENQKPSGYEHLTTSGLDSEPASGEVRGDSDASGTGNIGESVSGVGDT